MWSFCPGSGFRVTEPGSAGTLCWTEWNFGQIPSTTISLLWCLKSTFTFDQYMLLLRGVKDFLPVWDWSLCWFVQISVRLKTDLGPFLIGRFVVDPQTHQSEKDEMSRRQWAAGSPAAAAAAACQLWCCILNQVETLQFVHIHLTLYNVGILLPPLWLLIVF